MVGCWTYRIYRRIERIAHTAARPVEVNVITAVGERYELPAE